MSKDLASRRLHVRSINKQIFSSAIIICMISIHHKHRELTDQVKALTQHIWYCSVICSVIIRIQMQNRTWQTVHHITAWRFHDNISIYAPDPALSTAENILMMLREDRKYTPLEAKILDMALEMQNRTWQTVHHITAWRFHDNISYKGRRKRTTLYNWQNYVRKTIILRESCIRSTT